MACVNASTQETVIHTIYAHVKRCENVLWSTNGQQANEKKSNNNNNNGEYIEHELIAHTS